MDSAPETRSWMANWRDQKKIHICALLVVLWRCGRSHCLKISKNIEKIAILVILLLFFTNSRGGRSGRGPKIWTYILFGSISMSHVRFLNNLAWSRDLRVIQSKSTAPGPRGVPILLGQFRGSSRHCDCNVCLRMIFGDLWSFCQCRRRRTCQESGFSEKRLDFHEFSCIFL